MISAVVIVKNPGKDNWEGLGTHEFRVLPRAGERVELNIEGIGYSYEVVAVHHPLDPSPTGGVDIYAVRIGTVTDVTIRLLEDSPTAE